MTTLRARIGTPRARRAGSALVSCLPAGALLAACGPGVPEVADPLAGASTGTVPLPDNVGPADCQPVSPSESLPNGDTEVRGAAAAGASLWAKIDRSTPVPTGTQVHIIWRVP